MQEIFCPQEDSVLLAMRTGQWSESLRRHAAECPECREIAQVAGWMGGVAECLGREGALPDPTLTWLKAQLEEHRQAEQRRLRAVVIRQALVRLGLWLAVALPLFWMWPAVGNSVATASTSSDGLVYFPLLVTLVALFLGSRLIFSRLRGTFVH